MNNNIHSQSCLWWQKYRSSRSKPWPGQSIFCTILCHFFSCAGLL